MAAKIKSQVFQVSGLHCASCELVVERRLLKDKNIKAVEASVAGGQVRLEYHGPKPSIKKLNHTFKKEGYVFSETKSPKKRKTLSDFLMIVGIALLMIIGFLFLGRSGLSAMVSVNAQSALPAFFIFGLLAGFSTCSALVGGVVLSMAKQWRQQYAEESGDWRSFQPYLLFNFGRLVAFLCLGLFLGWLGKSLQLSPFFNTGLAIGVSLLMFILGLQMLGVRTASRFQPRVPKALTRFVAEESNFKGRWMPLLLGGLTFFLPCGFTITAQGLALVSGNPWQAGLIMFFFALGTLPALLLISFSSAKFTHQPHLRYRFLKIAGILVLFFSVYNFNSQLNVLGLKSLNDLAILGKTVSQDSLAPLVKGKQLIKMNALAYGYEPSYFQVKTGTPVRWEISDLGTSGCTNAVIAKGLFDGQIDLMPGQTSVREFLPTKPGKYKFSCWMGMVSGMIEVVGDDGRMIESDPEAVPIQALDADDKSCSRSSICTETLTEK